MFCRWRAAELRRSQATFRRRARQLPRGLAGFFDVQTAEFRRNREGATIMGELKDTIKGLGNEIAGNAKQAIGKARNDPAQQAEGKIQEKKGEVQQGVGKVKGALGDRI